MEYWKDRGKWSTQKRYPRWNEDVLRLRSPSVDFGGPRWTDKLARSELGTGVSQGLGSPFLPLGLYSYLSLHLYYN